MPLIRQDDEEWFRSEIGQIRAEILADRAQLARLKRLLGLETVTVEQADDHPVH
jgi:hypothetical protein